MESWLPWKVLWWGYRKLFAMKNAKNQWPKIKGILLHLHRFPISTKHLTRCTATPLNSTPMSPAIRCNTHVGTPELSPRTYQTFDSSVPPKLYLSVCLAKSWRTVASQHQHNLYTPSHIDWRWQGMPQPGPHIRITMTPKQYLSVV